MCNREALRRFEREAQTAGKLNHRNIVTVFDYGVLSTEGAFLVMELVAGEALSEVLNRKGKLDVETVVAWFGQVLDGVDAAHKAGIIHRDLKPDNIFVTRHEDETVRLCILDFGFARFNKHESTKQKQNEKNLKNNRNHFMRRFRRHSILPSEQNKSAGCRRRNFRSNNRSSRNDPRHLETLV
ncbi:MAG: serine/threonine protein kinase [Acidobacteria bacterium]|nr:serine/threonine protein kinase [Acidobacteriota bacterium]